MKDFLRGDVWYADLDPVVGSEQGGQRPVLICGNDIGNQNAPTVTVAPLTSQPKNSQPTHVILSAEWLGRESTVLLEQVRTVSKERLSDCIGSLNIEQMEVVDTALAVTLNLNILPTKEKKQMDQQDIDNSAFYDSYCKLTALYEREILSKREYETILASLKDRYESDLICV